MTLYKKREDYHRLTRIYYYYNTRLNGYIVNFQFVIYKQRVTQCWLRLYFLNYIVVIITVEIK